MNFTLCSQSEVSMQISDETKVGSVFALRSALCSSETASIVFQLFDLVLKCGPLLGNHVIH